MVERELYRVHDTDHEGNEENKTVIDVFRLRFPADFMSKERSSDEENPFARDLHFNPVLDTAAPSSTRSEK